MSSIGPGVSLICKRLRYLSSALDKHRSTKRVVNSTLSGREFLETIDSGSHEFREQFFIKDGRLYQAIYVGPRGTANSAEVQTFFNSVHIDH